MPACAETQVESGFSSSLKSASDLIPICRKSANFSRIYDSSYPSPWDKIFSKKYFRVRFVLFLYFVLSFENCLIWAFVSDGQLYIQDEDISNSFVFKIRNSNPKFKTKRQDAGMCRNSGWIRFLFLPKVCFWLDFNLQEKCQFLKTFDYPSSWDKMYFQEIFQGEIRLISLFCLIVWELSDLSICFWRSALYSGWRYLENKTPRCRHVPKFRLSQVSLLA